jgi:hypothetical protein
MTLICGIPFSAGVLVSGDRCWTDLERSWHGPEPKLFEIGGTLVTYSGQTAVHHPGDRLRWSLPHILADGAPAKLEERDIAGLARSAAAAYQRKWDSPEFNHPEDGAPACIVLFWLPNWTVADFMIRNMGGVATASEVRFKRLDPSESYTARPILQGQFADVVPVMRTGLSAWSTAFMRSQLAIRDVPLDSAGNFAGELQAAVARAAPKTVGGAVDMRVVGVDGRVSAV